MNKIFTFLGKPRTINHQISNRKVSWLELFYDLIFAVVIARLTDSLLDHLTISGIGYSVLLFGWFIWGWNEMSGYFDNHGNDSIINVLIINTEMILTGIGALFIPEAIGGKLGRLSIVLMAIELLMALVWFGLAYFDRIHGPASRVWGAVHLLSLAVMVVTYFINRFWLTVGLIIGLLLNIFDVIVANPRLAREYDQADMDHEIKDSMIERYGLMTMIALGEIIAGLYEAVNSRIDGAVIIRFIICIILVALVAAIYYQVLGTLRIILSSSIATILTGWLFILAIMFSFYMGVTIQMVLRYENTPQQTMGNLAFALSLILFLAFIRAIVFIGTETEKQVDKKLITIYLMIEGLILVGLAFVPTIWVLVGTVVILLVMIIQGRLLNQ
ncbi:MAG: low temperature requirement protein A [Lactobacillaceae bacterium]|nr:low temperature requirement protein A [Lactobacillaceae bacterium]